MEGLPVLADGNDRLSVSVADAITSRDEEIRELWSLVEQKDADLRSAAELGESSVPSEICIISVRVGSTEHTLLLSHAETDYPCVVLSKVVGEYSPSLARIRILVVEGCTDLLAKTTNNSQFFSWHAE